MSNEVSQQNSILSNATSAIASSAVMSGGFGSLSAVKRYGVKGAIKKAQLNSETIKEFLKKNNEGDVFTRGYVTARNYEELASAGKRLAKFEKITSKKSGVTFFQKIKQIFTKKDYKAINLEKFNDAKKAADTIEIQLKNGVDVAKVASKGTAKSLKGLFKSELKDPFGIFFAGTEFVERFTTQALPAFKEKGVVEGLKETGKALAAGVATWAADAGLSVAFRTAGAAVGSFLGPIGAHVGSIIGNAVGGMLSWSLVEKIFPKNDKQEEEENQIVQAEEPQAQNVSLNQAQVAFQGAQENNNLNINENTLSAEQVKKLAYAQVFPKYGATNSQMQKYYA